MRYSFSRSWLMSAVFLSVILLFPRALFAQEVQENPLPTAFLQSSVRVICDTRQGSGTIISADGAILTNAHVVANVETSPVQAAERCAIDVIDPETQAFRYRYEARVERWMFAQERNQDFALLRLTRALSPERLTPPFPFRPIWEFSEVNDRMWTLGYPSGGDLAIQPGYIQGFSQGFIRTTAVFRPGNSGGTALNERGELIGMPTRIVTITEDGKAQRIRYELVDIRAVLQWLDAIDPQERTRYFTFADPARSARSVAYIEQSSLECDYLARSVSASAVFCLLPGNIRHTFPNLTTYLSWYPSFEGIQTVPDEALADFRLSRNVTLRPGTLVKSQTMADTYLVTDIFGTMRHIPSEERAIELWGANWASLVRDIPDEFFTNYTIGPPLL
jgi:hypothetical protein